MTSLRSGIDAADALLGVFGLSRVAKDAMNPLDPVDFMALARNLSRHLWQDIAQPVEADILAAAIRALAIDDTDGADEMLAGLERAARQLDGLAPRIAPRIADAIAEASPALVGSTREAMARTLQQRLADALPAEHQRTLDFLASSQSHYVTNQYGVRIAAASEQGRVLVADGVRLGLAPKDIAKQLKEALADQVTGRSEAYYDTVASVWTNRARSYSQLVTLDEAKVRRYRWTSVMDSRTSDICRFLNGKISMVSTSLARMQEIAASTPESVKTLTPWARMAVLPRRAKADLDYAVGRGQRSTVRDPRPAEEAPAKLRTLYYTDASGERRVIARVDQRAEAGSPGEYTNKISQIELERSGLMVPPAHGRCRSSLTPVT